MTPGQAHQSTVLDRLLVGADTCLLDGEGKPVAWPVALSGDKGYWANWIDESVIDLGIQPVVPTPDNQDRAKRPVEFEHELYRSRNIVERLSGWLKESRLVFSRFEKSVKNFGGMIKLAFMARYLLLAAD